MVFHFPDATGTYPKIGMLPDFNDPVGLTEDIVLYIDDIVFSPTATGEPTVIKDPSEINFSVYPNPVKTTLYIENLDNAERISIYSMTGQRVLVRNELKSATAKINVSNLASGVYTISVEDRAGNSTIKKIIKE
jgi:hypothetical protein